MLGSIKFSEKLRELREDYVIITLKLPKCYAEKWDERIKRGKKVASGALPMPGALVSTSHVIIEYILLIFEYSTE